MRRMSLSSSSRSFSARGSIRSVRPRSRLAISLAASGLVHAALLAWVTVEVPETSDGPRLVDRAAPHPTGPKPDERLVHVVQIQPPGVMPSGGGASSPAGPSGAARTPAPVEPVGVPVALSPSAHTPGPGLTLAVAPASPVTLPDLAASDAEASRPSRPNRGIILRAPGAGDAFGSAGRGSSGRGGSGRGGTGVTIMGPGTDCITAGLARPEGRLPLALPDIGRRAQGSGIRTGRIGRSGW